MKYVVSMRIDQGAPQAAEEKWLTWVDYVGLLYNFVTKMPVCFIRSDGNETEVAFEHTDGSFSSRFSLVGAPRDMIPLVQIVSALIVRSPYNSGTKDELFRRICTEAMANQELLNPRPWTEEPEDWDSLKGFMIDVLEGTSPFILA